MTHTPNTLDNNGHMSQNDFQVWLTNIDHMVGQLLENVPENVSVRLDYSAESLDVLEKWMLDEYADIKSITAKDQRAMLNGIACYVGETFRKTIGGRWDIDLLDPKNAFYGLPILTDYDSTLGTQICPITLVTASAHRRTGTFLREGLNNYLSTRKKT
jgi:hypothetical protein